MEEYPYGLQRSYKSYKNRRQADRRRKSDPDPVDDEHPHGGCKGDGGTDPQT